MLRSTTRVMADTHGAGLRALRDRMKAMGGQRVVVGYPAGPTEPDGTPTWKVAMANELGVPDANGGWRVPERSFMRSAIREHASELVAFAEQAAVAVVEGTGSVAQALGRLGAFAVGKIQIKITSGPFTPNAPATIARKKSSKPLIDTGSLRSQITWLVEDDS